MPRTARAADPHFPRLFTSSSLPASGSLTVPSKGEALPSADRALLLTLQRQALEYFVENQAANGLILDRQRNHGPRRPHGLCSTSATGMGFISLALSSASPF